MKSIIIFTLLITTLYAQQYEYTSNVQSVTVTDTSVFIITSHDGTMYDREIKYVGDLFVIKKGKLERTIDTAEVTPEVKIKEVLTFKKIDKAK